ncbi:ionotropic receptor 21a-like isoform X3 [Bombus affinis]|uniref:Ionotropic receptor 21a isoform X3 n=1 Tax=Bombus terrestris TaxID=30195 RepID=A0A9B7HZJ0_BOMTE|nr:ionotropic receptor 21a isoform X3 [Bombus terrestris]XP_050586086.1 ionotropic receptor 21a-like isoform X3 [Bombus affinis]
MILVTLFLQIILVSGKSVFYKEHQCENSGNNLKSVVEEIVEEIINQRNCIVFVSDSVYRNLVDVKNIKGSSTVLKYEIALRDNEQFLQPRRRVQRILIDGKAVNCSAYIILIANGFLAAEFLQYTERIAVFEHIPAVTTKSRTYYNKQPNNNTEGLGIEFELMQIISKAMNFKPKYYMPDNITLEKWGINEDNQTHVGLVGEAIQGKAAFYLGDLHYTLHHLNYFDLTIPYNTECLTFLTPESLTKNSWKLLILPFKFYTWIALVLTLILGGVVFYFLSISYKKHISLYKNQMHFQNTSMKKEIKGLYLFTEIENSILYTYGMLFQISLPSLPSSWAVRVLIGWWWIYSILVAVAYRASMTATLANPVARVTIDTLEQLAKSSIEVGGWNKENKNFFSMSSDLSSQEIGNKFKLIQEEDKAIEKVANGSFAYYENSYLLQHVRVKRQILEKEQKENITTVDISSKHNLHIMEECVINMPIALGLEKNSPLKPRVDTLIRRIIEIGLVEKWLSDVMEWSKIMEIRQEAESEKALVDLHKLQGAFIAIIVGYILAFMVLIGEILYWKHIVLKDPKFDKYHLDIFYSINNPKI